MLGIPLIFGDTSDNRIKFHKPEKNIDVHNYLLLAPKYKADMRNLTINLLVNYDLEIITYKYVSTSDIISRLGGYKSAIEPILMFFYPMVILQFLIAISFVIIKIYKDRYLQELEQSARKYFEKLKRVEDIEIILKNNDKYMEYLKVQSHL